MLIGYNFSCSATWFRSFLLLLSGKSNQVTLVPYRRVCQCCLARFRARQVFFTDQLISLNFEDHGLRGVMNRMRRLAVCALPLGLLSALRRRGAPKFDIAPSAQ